MDWDDSVFLGVIPEARRTFNVIGNANERGLVIGETTFGGLPELDCHGTGGVMDYGSLIWIALQRAETCAEAIDVIDSLVQTYGYASDGESFSCVDGAEAWLRSSSARASTSEARCGSPLASRRAPSSPTPTKRAPPPST